MKANLREFGDFCNAHFPPSHGASTTRLPYYGEWLDHELALANSNTDYNLSGAFGRSQPLPDVELSVDPDLFTLDDSILQSAQDAVKE